MKELALLLLLVLLLVVVLAVIVLVRARLRVRVVIGCRRPARDGDLACDLANREAILVTQNQILKSSGMWMVSYFWRLVNPQTMTQYQLLALLYSRECELVREK